MSRLLTVARALAPFAAYALVLLASSRFLSSHPESRWRIPVALAPVVPIVWIAVVQPLARVRAMDELQRRKHLEAGTFAFAVTLVYTITYGFLERVGLPPVNLMFVGAHMIMLFLLGQLITWLRYR